MLAASMGTFVRGVPLADLGMSPKGTTVLRKGQSCQLYTCE